MAPQYKLTYFDVRGLAEPIRFLMAYGGIEYEDVRVNRDDWPAFKGQTPVGQVPMLESGGKTYHQNAAVARYFGKKVGLAGKTDEENMEIDAVVDTITDFRLHLRRFFYEENAEIKESLKKNLDEVQYPFYFELFNKWAGENNGYLCLGKLTWADLYFTAMMESIIQFGQIDLSKNYANLSKLQDNVLNIKSIKKWVETRPKTDM